MNQDAINYLQENKGKYSKEILIKQLQNSGYGEEDIAEAVKNVFAEEEAAGGNSNGEVKYAGFWIRWVAVILDGIIVNVAWAVVAIPLGIASYSMTGAESNPVFNSLSLLMYPLMWAYYIFMTNKYQATLGKMALGLKVVAEDGQRAELGKIILRETVGKILSGITLGIGYIMAGFTQKKQALHDMVASTAVVYKDPSKKIKGWVIAVIIGLFLIPIFGILVSIVLVSLNSAKDRAQDVSVKSVVAATVPQALIYYDENKTFNGFESEIAKEGRMPECSGSNLIVNISSDGQEAAIFGELCSRDDAYYCAEASSDPNKTSKYLEVNGDYVRSGKASCQ